MKALRFSVSSRTQRSLDEVVATLANRLHVEFAPGEAATHRWDSLKIYYGLALGLELVVCEIVDSTVAGRVIRFTGGLDHEANLAAQDEYGALDCSEFIYSVLSDLKEDDWYVTSNDEILRQHGLETPK